MKTPRLLLLLLLVGLGTSARAAEVDLTPVFTQLKGNGAAPFATMLYGADQENVAKLVDQLAPLMKQSGDYLAYEIVARNFLTKRVERLIIAIYFERYPIYLRIDSYWTPRGKIWLPAVVSKDPDALLPFDVISAAGK